MHLLSIRITDSYTQPVDVNDDDIYCSYPSLASKKRTSMNQADSHWGTTQPVYEKSDENCIM